jgi:N6-L-threonylcarbamoyladenine synthase
VRILGIETSCDETGVALFEAGRGIVAQRLSSQIQIHAPFGGVVPELASRDHIAKLVPLVREVMHEAGTEFSALDAVAYTAGPGLIGALLVGGAFAAALATALKIPAVPVHHMEGHLLACMLEADTPDFPFLALLVSGGHSQLVHVAELGRYRIVGETLDDAAGEAFDKVARLLSLPYPGGPQLAALAESGDAARFAFPRPLKNQGLDMSFSGLKTAVRIAVDELGGPTALRECDRADVAASFQAAVVETLVAKCRAALAATQLARIVIAGGVGANLLLRERLRAFSQAAGARVYYPRPALCTDNGAMIAYAGWRRVGDAAGRPQIVAKPRWPLDELTPPLTSAKVASGQAFHT